MKHVDLEIKYEGSEWRVVDNATEKSKRPYLDKTKGDTVQWKAPDDRAVLIIMLKESPLLGEGGSPAALGVFRIEAGKSSALFTVDSKADSTPYYYAALVLAGNRECTYVRGENSPPGIIVGP